MTRNDEGKRRNAMTPNDAGLTGNTELMSIEKVQEIMKRHAEHLDLMHSRFGPEGNSLMRYDADDQALTALKPLGLDLARLCLSLAARLQQLRPVEAAARKLLGVYDEFNQFDVQDALASADPEGLTPYSHDDDRAEAGERLDIAERDLRSALTQPAEAGDQS